VAVDVLLKIADGTAVGLDGAFGEPFQADVLLLSVDRRLAAWVVGDEGEASLKFFLSMIKRSW
jgi:hypothetical protein